MGASGERCSAIGEVGASIRMLLLCCRVQSSLGMSVQGSAGTVGDKQRLWVLYYSRTGQKAGLISVWRQRADKSSWAQKKLMSTFATDRPLKQMLRRVQLQSLALFHRPMIHI